MNRDSKKQRKPFSAEDFCFFIDHQVNKPEARAAVAFMALVREKQLPAWALSFFADFKHGAPTKTPLKELVLKGEQFIMLAPVEIDGGFSGTMIAEHAVSNKEIEVEHMDMIYTIQVPAFEDYVCAKNNVEVDITQPPRAL